MKSKRKTIGWLLGIFLVILMIVFIVAFTYRGRSVADAERLNKGMTFDEVTVVFGTPSYPPHTAPYEYRVAFWELSDGYVRMLFDPQLRLVIVVSRPETPIPMLVRRVKWKFKLD